MGKRGDGIDTSTFYYQAYIGNASKVKVLASYEIAQIWLGAYSV